MERRDATGERQPHPLADHVNLGVHVVHGEAAADRVRAALNLQDMRQSVVALRDPLDVGPLWDLGAGGSSRSAFWNAVGVHVAPHDLDRKAWSTLVSAPVVTVWHGPNAREHLMFLRVADTAHRLRRDLFEIVWTPDDMGDSPDLEVGLVGISARALADLPSTAARVTSTASRSWAWRSVSASRRSVFRQLVDGAIVGRPLAEYDERLVAGCGDDWTPVVRVIRELVRPFHLALVLEWRLRELVEQGVLEGRGRGMLGIAEARVPAR